MDLDMTVGQARDVLRDAADDGMRCPCCTQLVKVYRRKLNSGMARSLIAMFQVRGTDWCYVPGEVGARSREEGKLRYWGLVEEERERRPDGGRAGFWRVTDLGRRFVLGEVTVPKYARVFDSRCLGLVGEQVSIFGALGDRFDYDELMGAA